MCVCATVCAQSEGLIDECMMCVQLYVLRVRG